MRPRVFTVLASAIGLLVATAGAVNSAEAAGSASPKPPKTDVFDRFDDGQSPLQRAMLDARDSRWRGKAKLGSDPRCGRVVREFAREEGKPSPAHPRLCFDAAGEAIPQERCVQLYCCGDGETNCPEAACGQALITGEDLSPCFDAGATPDACVERIYKKGAQPRVIDCLESPVDANGELRSKCRPLFDGCPSIPFLTSEKDSARSGVIKDSENREVGRRIQSRTVVHYDNAGQRRPHSMGEQADGGWDPIRIEPSRPASREQGVPGAVPAVGTVLSAATFNPGCDPDVRCPANDDGDCVDRANGRAYGPADCFDADHRLRRTLTFTSDPCPSGSVCCRHTGLAAGDATGEVFQDDDCLVDPAGGAVPGNLRTTLVQKIDEDPFDALNNDGDCTDGTVVTSDCLDSSGGLRAGFRWNVDEEICDGANQDQDCLNALGKVGMLREGRCLDEHGAVIGETPGVDFIDRIDEDCPETAAGADTLDNDRDGAFGEDPPNAYSAPAAE